MELPPRRPQRRALATINVTPLVDVMLVLLIIFMVTVSLGQQGLTVNLPQVQAPAQTLSSVVVTVDSAGRVTVDSVLCPEASLTAVVSQKLTGREQRRVTLQADQAALYGSVARVVSRIQAAGADVLVLASQAEALEP